MNESQAYRLVRHAAYEQARTQALGQGASDADATLAALAAVEEKRREQTECRAPGGVVGFVLCGSCEARKYKDGLRRAIYSSPLLLEGNDGEVER